MRAQVLAIKNRFRFSQRLGFGEEYVQVYRNAFSGTCSHQLCNEERENELETHVSNLEKEVATLNSQLVTVRTKLDDTSKQITELHSTAFEIEGAMQRFMFDDWKAVTADIDALMYDVIKSTSKVEAAIEESKKAAKPSSE